MLLKSHETPSNNLIGFLMSAQLLMGLLALLFLTLLAGCADTVPVETIKIQKINPPQELLTQVPSPDVPDCKKDSCVASFIVLEDQALKTCQSKLTALNLWARN